MNLRRRRISLRPCSRRSWWSPSRRCSCPSWPRARPSRPRSSGRPAGRPLDDWPRRRRPGSPSAPTPAAGGRSGPAPGGASSASASTSWSGWPRTPRNPSTRRWRCRCSSPRGCARGCRSPCAASWSPPTPTPPPASRSAQSWPARRTALLVVGDGAATHTEKAPGYLDERAGPFDDAVAAALATADPAALAALDPALAADLWAAGRAPWQVLAGATRDGTWEGELLHSTRTVRRRLPRGGVAAVRLIAVVGPTAAGKSDLALALARALRRRDRQRRRHAALPRPGHRHRQS